MKSTMGTIAAVVVLALLGAGCGGSSGEGDDRAGVLGDLADAVIVPRFEELDATATAWSQATGDLCTMLGDADPTADVATAIGTVRDGMASTRDAWLRTQAMWVGPVMERRSWAVVDWPIAADEVDALIADTDSDLSVDWIANRIGADQRGLQAIDYVLGDDADATLAALDDERHCQFVESAVALISEEAGTISADWTVGDPEPYRTTFVDPDSGDLDSLINDGLFLLEAMTDTELGKALGVMDESGQADAAAIREGATGDGVSALLARLDGLHAVFEGLAPLLGDDLNVRLESEFNAAAVALSNIDGPLRAAVTDNRVAVEAARDALKVIQITVSTEVVGQLGVTIGFSDADGDSG